MARYEGRLELTWTNKHLRLLAHEDGSYEWVNPADYRVAEVRLLHDITTAGEVGKKRAADNLLIRGDALNALTSLARLPEFATEYLGKVKLCYIDPPFNTQQSFLHYDDGLEHSVWLTMMRDRLLQIRELLAQDGSIWVHLDDSEVANCRSVLDEVMGRDCFVTTFIWQKVDSPNDNKVAVTPDHEYLLCYTRSPGVTSAWHRKPDPSIAGAYGSVDDHGHRYRDRLLRKNGKNSLRSDRPTMWFPVTAPDGTIVYPVHDDGREACWSLGLERVTALIATGQLVWKQRRRPDGSEQWVPYTREWAPQTPARPWPTIWTDVKTTRQAKAHMSALFPSVTGFATPKPEQLIARILEISSEPGDVVLDCFLGSGTTAAVAHKMGRRWVGIERESQTIDSFALPRLTKVVAGDDPGGITDIVGWSGGGGFRVLDVGPSMFEAQDGLVFLAEWMVNGALAEATAAQLGFEYEADPPFSGRKGRMRLAVIDGVVNEAVVRLLIGTLSERERLVICGTGVDPDARDVLRQLRRGSTLRKIPATLLDEYRSASPLRVSADERRPVSAS